MKPCPDFSSPQFLDEMTLIVSRAAGDVMRIRSSTLSVRTKSDLTPVTNADDAAEEVILDGLSRLFPGIAIISEEAFTRGSCPEPGSTFAIIDPLDGTREIIAGRDEFTVNVAIVNEGRPAIGVITAPARGLIWRGGAGHRAECLHLAPGEAPRDARDRVPIHARKRKGGKVVAVVSRSHLDPATLAFLKGFPQSEQIMCGSALKFCLLAEGRADIYPRLAPTSEWDVAAGDAILTAAGGTVRTPEGAPLPYGRRAQGFRVPAFIAWADPEMSISTTR